ncbi:MAG: hypothetical protein P4L36_19460 [Holophaga sp.]|nr:hypothetical protein [Holophaga sp.]
MMICSWRPCGFALLVSLLLGPGGRAWGAEARREFFNRSGQEWRLTLVEGTRAGVGKLNVIDKFSGNLIRILTRTGDSVQLPAGARFLVEFTRENNYCFHDFIVQDSRGDYAEFLVSIPFQADSSPVLSFKDKHVGPPLDQATDEAVLLAIQDAISTENGNLIILRDAIGPKPASTSGW